MYVLYKFTEKGKLWVKAIENEMPVFTEHQTDALHFEKTFDAQDAIGTLKKSGEHIRLSVEEAHV